MLRMLVGSIAQKTLIIFYHVHKTCNVSTLRTFHSLQMKGIFKKMTPPPTDITHNTVPKVLAETVQPDQTYLKQAVVDSSDSAVDITCPKQIAIPGRISGAGRQDATPSPPGYQKSKPPHIPLSNLSNGQSPSSRHSFKRKTTYGGTDEPPNVVQPDQNSKSNSENQVTLNHKINDMVQKFWRSDIESKSSTKYLNPNVLSVGSSHHIWSTVRNNIHDSRRAQIKCKLLTGTYILQANRAAFNQYAVNPTCKLCNTAPETRQHFVGECAFFKEERKLYIEKLETSPINEP